MYTDVILETPHGTALNQSLEESRLRDLCATYNRANTVANTPANTGDNSDQNRLELVKNTETTPRLHRQNPYIIPEETNQRKTPVSQSSTYPTHDFAKHSEKLQAFYRDCFHLRTPSANAARRPRTVGWVRNRPRTTTGLTRAKNSGHTELYDERRMMAPHNFPDITPRDKPSAKKQSSNMAPDKKKTNEYTEKMPMKRTGSKTSSETSQTQPERAKSHSLASSSGSGYCAKPSAEKKANIHVQNSTYENNNTKTRNGLTNSETKLTDRTISETVKDNDMSGAVLGKLRDMTLLKKEQTSFSLFESSENDAKVSNNSKPKVRQKTTSQFNNTQKTNKSPGTQKSIASSTTHKITTSSTQKPNTLHHCASESQLIPQKRRLSKQSDFATKPLHRFNSEVKLSKETTNINRNISTRDSNRKYDFKRNKSTVTSGNICGMRSYNSTFALNVYTGGGGGRVSRDTGSAKTADDVDDDDDDMESQTDRIYEWLVDAEDAEAPPEQVIDDFADIPKQTDTAVHIVYGGD